MKEFTKTSLEGNPLQKGEYEDCSFKGCDFSETDLSEFRFSNCVFTDCNLSMAKLSNTAFREISFRDCKLLGLHFDDCNKFGLAMQFDQCILNLSSFYKLKLPKTLFRNSRLEEVDFAECDLTAAVFENCDLSGAVFDHTNLEKADLRTAYNFNIEPSENRIRKAKFSVQGLPGLLRNFEIEID